MRSKPSGPFARLLARARQLTRPRPFFGTVFRISSTVSTGSGSPKVLKIDRNSILTASEARNASETWTKPLFGVDLGSKTACHIGFLAPKARIQSLGLGQVERPKHLQEFYLAGASGRLLEEHEELV